MSLLSDHQTEVKTILAKEWERRRGQVVPEPAELKLGNDAVILASKDGGNPEQLMWEQGNRRSGRI